mmetsp:Transcript_18917/g.46869  ORF Transcript_18917/g.46869 Transcript_18917/m.46869 type:complete len:198 (+) Transcript_18917:117-710(+)
MTYNTTSMEDEDRKVVFQMPENDKCVDCGTAHAEWASVSYGTILCLDCSGVHRSLGVHLSFVRSIKMDAWSEKQLQVMKSGGNAQCRAFLQKWGVNVDYDRSKIKERYESPAAELYREVLKARIEGRPEPTELPEQKEAANAAPMKMKMEGFGSTPHPSTLPKKKKKKFSKKAIIAGVASAAIGVGAVAIQLSKNNR